MLRSLVAGTALAFATLTFAACGGDDMVSPLDGGATSEGGSDASVPDDASNLDAGTLDAKSEGDAAKDANDAANPDANGDADGALPVDVCLLAQDAGELSTDGGPSTDALLDTRTGLPATLPCAAAPGGNAAAVRFSLSSATDLHVAFRQLGEHAFMILADPSPPSTCDSDTLLACGAATGLDSSGSQDFVNLPPGEYVFVAAGDQPDTPTTKSSGAMDLTLTATPHM